MRNINTIVGIYNNSKSESLDVLLSELDSAIGAAAVSGRKLIEVSYSRYNSAIISVQNLGYTVMSDINNNIILIIFV